MNTDDRASRRISFRQARLHAALATAALLAFGSPAAADTFRSWSYVTLPDGSYLMDGHSPVTDPSLWQPGSSVEFDSNNFARSQIGFDSLGRLEARIGVSGAWPVRGHVHSDLSYRDEGFICAGDVCGTAVPQSASLDIRLQQDGRFTEGTANFGVSYALWTAGTFYQFHFAVEQGEMALRPYGGFATENRVTGQTTFESIFIKDALGNDVFNPLFNLVWDDVDQDGVFTFAYDLAFTVLTQGADLREELSMSAYVYGSPGGQFFDSWNSFQSTWTPQAGVTLSSPGGRFAEGPTLPVPEPTGWAMLLAGLGLIGLKARNRSVHPARAG